MKFFTDKSFLFKLIVALCICLTLINFGITPIANAESKIAVAGGVLLDPVVDLLLVLGDGVMGIIQKSIMGTDATAIFDNKEESGWLRSAVKWIVITLAVCAAVVILGGVSVVALITTAVKVLGAAIIAEVITDGGVTAACSLVSAVYFDDTVVLPTYTISPEEIFSGKILLFNPNVFNPKELYVKYKDEGSESPIDENDWTSNVMLASEWNDNPLEKKEVQCYFYYKNGKSSDDSKNIVITSTNNSAYELKDTIAKWYYTIRTIAIIGLSIVLVYIGIKILLSSVASEKSKYKQMLNDWVIALCLVFLMQYIMVFANSFVESISNMLTISTSSKTHIAFIEESTEKLQEEVKKVNSEYVDGDVIGWPTNLMGKFRVEAQERDGTAEYAGYAICYLVLVMYTVFFTYTYLKRLLYLLFLTVISPFVAMTYPLDKIKDGQAQAFNMWMKEYIYNLLIQPFHLLLYTIFVSMAFDLAGTSIIYSLVVIGFMIPAEKFLRTMFGFNKASTPGFLGGAGGAVMTMSAIKSLAGFAAGGKSGAGKNAGGNNNKIKDADNKGYYDRSADSGNNISSLLGEVAAESEANSENTDNKLNDQQKMLDAYDEGYGTDSWDAAERDNYARATYAENGNDDSSMQYSNDEYKQILKDAGYSDEEIAELMDENNSGSASDNPVENENPEQVLSPEEQILGENSDSTLEPRMSYLGARFSNFVGDNFNAQKAKERAAEVLKGGAKNVAKFGLGAAGAGIGIAAGIASGSPGDVLKYGASGAYAGSSIGQGTANRIASSIQHADEVEKQKHEEALRTQYGNKLYKQLKNDELDEKFMKDADMRKLYKQKLDLKNKEEIDSAMKKAVEFRKYGITDNEVITKAIKLDKNYKTSIEVPKENIAAAKLATVSKSQKDFDTYMKKYKDMPGVDSKKYNSMYKKVKDINSEYLV